MPAFLDANWSPMELFPLVVAVAGAVSLIVLILTIYGYNLRALADATALQRERLNAETALKRELIQRGLAPPELEQTVKLLNLDESPPAAPNPSGESSDAEFAKLLFSLEGITPQAIEEIITLVRTVDGPRRRAALSVINELMERGVEAGPFAVAAIRSLCRPPTLPLEEAKPLDLSSHVTPR
jgi:hypothetical protein